MIRFHYKSFDRAGLVTEGDVDAPSVNAVLDLVRARGFTPFDVKQSVSTEYWWRRDLFGSGAPTRSAIAAFTCDLAILLQARIPLAETLKLVSEQTSDRSVRRLAMHIGAEVTKGAALSDAMAGEGDTFGADYLSIVRAGELSGLLGEVFSELSMLEEKRMVLDAKIKSALIYPAVLVTMACVSVGVIAAVLVPTIAPIFLENGKTLPPFIGAVMAVHDNLGAAFAAIAVIIGLLFAIRLTIAKVPYCKASYHGVQLRSPVIGPLILQRETARLTRTFGTLLKAGVPIMPSLTSAVAGVVNLRIGSALTRSIEGLREGSSLAHALRRQAVLPTLAVQMIAVGEESGQLDILLLRAAALFEEMSTRRVDRMMSLLTPFLTILIAGFVGVLIMSVMSAILSINDLATQ